MNCDQFTQDWKEDPPTERGVYWFYGFASVFDRRAGAPRQEIVWVRKISSGWAYFRSGEFLDRRAMFGYWLRIQEPTPPAEEFWTKLETTP